HEGRGSPLGGVGGDEPPPSAHRGLQGQERTAVRIAQWMGRYRVASDIPIGRSAYLRKRQRTGSCRGKATKQPRASGSPRFEPTRTIKSPGDSSKRSSLAE